MLLALGAPAMGTYLQNSKLGSAASNYFQGAQMARTEAIRRNVRTEFVLTDTPIATANLANVVAPAVNGRNWIVRAAAGGGLFTLLEAKSGAEGDASSRPPVTFRSLARRLRLPCLMEGSPSTASARPPTALGT